MANEKLCNYLIGNEGDVLGYLQKNTGMTKHLK